MRDESASLAEAYAEYAAEARLRLKASTWRTYDHYIPAFLASGATALRDITPLRVKAFVNAYTTQGKVHGAHNAMIALRAFSRWLAKEKVFYAPGGLPTLAGCDLPAVPKTGRPAYTPEEVHAIERTIATHPQSALLSAVHWLQLGTGIRANETRLLKLRDVSLPTPDNDHQGHIVVREDTTKTAAEARETPLDPKAAQAIRRYHGKLSTAELKRYPTTLAKYGELRNNGLRRTMV